MSVTRNILTVTVLVVLGNLFACAFFTSPKNVVDASVTLACIVKDAEHGMAIKDIATDCQTDFATVLNDVLSSTTLASMNTPTYQEASAVQRNAARAARVTQPMFQLDGGL